jgi:hypothetical protein
MSIVMVSVCADESVGARSGAVAAGINLMRVQFIVLISSNWIKNIAAISLSDAKSLILHGSFSHQIFAKATFTITSNVRFTNELIMIILGILPVVYRINIICFSI